MVKFYIDGLASTTKTTILHLLRQKHSDWNVRLTDFSECIQTLKDERIADSKERNTLIYVMLRCSETFDPLKINICDRHPAASIAYNFIFDPINFNEMKTERTFLKIKKLFPDWRGCILLPKDGQEKLIVKFMKKRNNGLDIFTEDYVTSQIRIYKIWAKIMQTPIRYIDFEKDLDIQQINLMTDIESMISHSKDDANITTIAATDPSFEEIVMLDD